MRDDLRQAIGTATQSTVAGIQPMSGGDINQAHRLELSDGRRLFVKSNPSAPSGLFAEEARGLNWLRQAHALALPEVIAVGERPCPYLILEFLPSLAPAKGDWERLGRGLAGLHTASAPAFGGLPNNFIGTLPQCNESADTWSEFFCQRRLLPQLRLAVDGERLPPGVVQSFAVLESRVTDWLLEPPKPQRVHGDLWSGNLLFAEQRGPCLIDPAAYAGHGEMDLAMMHLFGGFSPRTFDAYREVLALEPDLESRILLYQLYPLLVHVNLFGGSYAVQVRQILRQLVG